MSKTEYRGGVDPERLYLENAEFDLPDQTHVIISATDIPGVDMDTLRIRHLARYGIVALFCRPGYKILDFPCGSGYASLFLARFRVHYFGWDIDPITIEYAKNKYGGTNVNHFGVNNLCNPILPKNTFDVVGCIEGLEHIPAKNQYNLIGKLRESLKPGGILVISSPENPTGISGKSIHNPYHAHELTKKDFLKLLHTQFQSDKVEIITTQEFLSTNVATTCFYAVCHN